MCVTTAAWQPRLWNRRLRTSISEETVLIEKASDPSLLPLVFRRVAAESGSEAEGSVLRCRSSIEV